ncbi:hypothetical protein D920_01021 [Enterococcus faecalis 13-SD-W-01]|nr:hypothetical protein D920_01021 [Enterococcus faecalis 13-SD-W-01]
MHDKAKGGIFLSQDEVKKHLDKGRYGSPLVNPDEQHKYMGTFRERCYLSMTISEMKKPENQSHLLDELDRYPDASILLNGAMPESLQSTYIQLATQKKAHFTVINDFVTAEPESFGLLLTAKEAVNEPVIDIEEKYPKTATQQEEPEQTEDKKESFWSKLFH